jgi:hypothetical protein
MAFPPKSGGPRLPGIDPVPKTGVHKNAFVRDICGYLSDFWLIIRLLKV